MKGMKGDLIPANREKYLTDIFPSRAKEIITTAVGSTGSERQRSDADAQLPRETATELPPASA